MLVRIGTSMRVPNVSAAANYTTEKVSSIVADVNVPGNMPKVKLVGEVIPGNAPSIQADMNVPNESDVVGVHMLQRLQLKLQAVHVLQRMHLNFPRM